MIELYFWTTPNGYKPLLLLEETEHQRVDQPEHLLTQA